MTFATDPSAALREVRRVMRPPGRALITAWEAGLALDRTMHSELAIRDGSPDAYVAGGRNHPVSLAVRPSLREAGVELEATDAMIAILRDANEDPDAFLVHSPVCRPRAPHRVSVGC